MKYTPREQKTNVNVTPTSPLREFFVLTGGLLAIVIGIYLLLGLAVDLLVPRLSPEFERKLATLFVESLDDDDVRTGEAKHIQSLVQAMEARCTDLPYEFTVHVQESELVNALAFPGGHIVLFTGLLDKVASENELMFVLGHEMGHYAHRDHLRGLGRAIVLTSISTLLLGPDSDVSRVLVGGLSLTEMSFSRGQEIWADEFGLEVTQCFYGHVGGATDFFEKISKESDADVFGHYFSTHPENRERIEHLEKLAHERKYRIDSLKPFVRKGPAK